MVPAMLLGRGGGSVRVERLRNRTKTRQDVDDSAATNKISWYFISFDYRGTRTRGIIEFIINFRGTAISRGNEATTVVASDSHPFSTGGLHFYLQSTGSLARMAAQPFPHQEEIK